MRQVFRIGVILGAAFLFVGGSHAQVMTSPNYQIQFDSVNVGGGLSDSASYSLESTVGEVATGESDSASYSLRAGYQQMQAIYLALTASDDVSMTPNLGGVSGGTSNGSTTFTATTDSPSGYEITIEASDAPAMNSPSDSIADYDPAGAAPDFTFNTDATDAHFGFSPFSTHVAARFRDSGGTCDHIAGNNTAERCWDGLSMTPQTIVQSGSPNHPSGTETTIYFRVGLGSSVVQPSGTYVATTTVTMLPL